MAIDVNITREARWHIAGFLQYGENVQNELVPALLKAGKLVQGQAKENAPVDTSLLRRSIAVRLQQENGETIVQIGTNVHYAIHVEFGHRVGKTGRYVAGVYFLRNALVVKRRQAKGIILEAMIRAMRR